MKRAFVRNNNSLTEIYEFAEGVLAAGDVSDASRFSVHLALEELFVNMVKFSPDATGNIDIEISATGDKVTVSLTEFGVAEFDVTAPRTVDTNATLDTRTPGGLGVYLIQNLTDSLEYAYNDGRSRVIFTKKSRI